MKKKITYIDLEANSIYNKINKSQIMLINKSSLESSLNMIPRDAYYEILDMLKVPGKAIGIVGLRRTGKSTILNQLHSYLSDTYGEDCILHLKLIEVFWQDLCQYIDSIRQQKDIKYILIDEITLCEDLILAGKGLMDQLINSGIKVIITGAESFSLQKAYEESLYGRLLLKDISFISFKEYCKLKRIETNSIESLNESFYNYLKNGNILDTEYKVDDKYIQTAIGVNLALSIINSDITEFNYFESNLKELTELIIKYLRLISYNIVTEIISKEISNKEAVKTAFENYQLQFNSSDIQLDNKQLNIIDEALSRMGILYSLTNIPYYKSEDKYPQSEDIVTLNSYLWNKTSEICKYLESSDIGLSDDDIAELNNNIQSAMLGRLIENCIAVHYIKELEKSCELPINAKSYAKGKYVVNRKCTKMHMYKYNNGIEEKGKSVTAEVDLILNTADTIKLIEVKKSTVVDEHQTRWLNNETVIDEIRQKISSTKPIEKYVYYMGETCEIEDIHYRNIPSELLKD